MDEDKRNDLWASYRMANQLKGQLLQVADIFPQSKYQKFEDNLTTMIHSLERCLDVPTENNDSTLKVTPSNTDSPLAPTDYDPFDTEDITSSSSASNNVIYNTGSTSTYNNYASESSSTSAVSTNDADQLSKDFPDVNVNDEDRPFGDEDSSTSNDDAGGLTMDDASVDSDAGFDDIQAGAHNTFKSSSSIDSDTPEVYKNALNDSRNNNQSSASSASDNASSESLTDGTNDTLTIEDKLKSLDARIANFKDRVSTDVLAVRAGLLNHVLQAEVVRGQVDGNGYTLNDEDINDIEKYDTIHQEIQNDDFDDVAIAESDFDKFDISDDREPLDVINTISNLVIEDWLNNGDNLASVKKALDESDVKSAIDNYVNNYYDKDDNTSASDVMNETTETDNKSVATQADAKTNSDESSN